VLADIYCYLERYCDTFGVRRVGSMTTEILKPADAVARPLSVVWYERLAWAAMAMGSASSAANPAQLARNYDRYANGFLVLFVLSMAVQLTWIWLVARKRQNWARWISLIVVLIGIPFAFRGETAVFVRSLNTISAILWYAAYAMHLISVLLLFRGDEIPWHHLVSP
jgi:hypothetical protein